MRGWPSHRAADAVTIVWVIVYVDDFTRDAQRFVDTNAIELIGGTRRLPITRLMQTQTDRR